MGHLAREWSVPYVTVAEILTLKCFFRPITPGKISSRAKSLNFQRVLTGYH